MHINFPDFIRTQSLIAQHFRIGYTVVQIINW